MFTLIILDEMRGFCGLGSVLLHYVVVHDG